MVLLVFSFLLPDVGTIRFLNYMYLFVVRRYFKLPQDTHHTLFLGRGSMHQCRQFSFLLVPILFHCFVCTPSRFRATERPSFMFCSISVDDSPSFSFLMLLWSAKVISCDVERVLPLLVAPSQTLIRFDGPPPVRSRPVVCQTPRIIFRQSFALSLPGLLLNGHYCYLPGFGSFAAFFLICSVSSLAAHCMPRCSGFDCTSSSGFSLPFVLVYLPVPQRLVLLARRDFCPTFSFALSLSCPARAQAKKGRM